MDAQQDESWMVGLVTPLLEPRFIIIWVFLVMSSIFLLDGALCEAQRINLVLHGRQRCRQGIIRAISWVIRAPWCLIKAISSRTQLLIRLFHLPGAAASTASTIAPSPHLQSGQSTTKEDLGVAIPQHCFRIIIWNEHSLKTASKNIIANFKEINHPIQCGTGHSPYASNCSSPIHYEYNYGVSSGYDEYNDRHLRFKPYSFLEYGNFKLINPSLLSRLDKMIFECPIIDAQILCKAFAEHSDVLDRLLYNSFNSAGLCIRGKTYMNASEFTYQSARRYVMIFKTTTKLLHVMREELAETDCQSFSQDLKICYFAACAKRPIQSLIEMANSISKLNWSASNIYQMLVLFEAIHDVIPALQGLCIGCPDESDSIFQQMTIKFKDVLNSFSCSISYNLNGSLNGIARISHPVTDSLLHCMELFKDHNSIVKKICYVGDGCSSLHHLIYEVISCWAHKLKEHSELYTEGRKYIFLLNNLSYFALEITIPLQGLLQDSQHVERIEMMLKSRISEYTSAYLESCWGPVRDCLKLSSTMKCHGSPLAAFNANFDDVYGCQRTWVLHAPLKLKLRVDIQKFIVPSYTTFLTEPQRRPLPFQRFLCWKHGADWYRTIEQLETDVDNLFESEQT